MRYSASRIKTYQTCKRRYVFIYHHDKREPAARSAEGGTKTHELLEVDSFRGDETWQGLEIGRMATVLRAATPANVQTREQKLDVDIEGVPFTMRVDFTTADTVGDYKTTSKKSGVRSVEQLIDDPQRLLYTRGTGLSDSLWIYGVWEDFRTWPVHVAGDSARDRERFHLRVMKPVEEMSLLPADVDPLSVEANVLACSLYPPHGCPFIGSCYDSNGSLITRTSNMSIFDVYKQPANDAPAAVVAITQPANANSKPIGTLFVDAYPIIGFDAVTPASGLIARAAQSVCDDLEVKHSQLVDFGKGQYMLAAQLVSDIKASGEYYPAMYLETRSAEGKACLFELSNLSKCVVKGMI